ncbi:plasmid p 4b orf-3 family protein [Purpureocillium lavendulum]|uniref:Plasmid p 4b orf-3 family protein n=1 Tax=Purpureocillium lavendulum TaxID=1247861 RepID=A0AB34FER7_9HYPO|nr:plasmid p 4b orf-3 family protein [Purpureocillium lavendulum]
MRPRNRPISPVLAFAMPGPRLPPALQVFPTLQRFPALRPRRQQSHVPIGCSGAKVDDASLQLSALHLYHDLGVLVFAGASPQQTQRIGDILKQVVAWGGPGAAAARLGWGGGGDAALRTREGKLARADVFDTVESRRAGVIRPEALLRMATARFREMLEGQISKVQPELKKVHIQETQVMIPGSPLPNGTLHQTVRGLRPLPVDSLATMGIDRATGRAVGEARFFAAGTGAYVGAARVDYVVYHFDETAQAMRPFWAHGRLARRKPGGAEARAANQEVRTLALEPLWELEREIWAPRADALALETPTLSVHPGTHHIQAAAAATLVTDLAVHPAETLITRLQSPAYATRYKTAHGAFHRSFFAGLYQGFGPTVVAGVPASAAFFTVYEGLKAALLPPREGSGDQRLVTLPAPVAHAVSSAAGDVVACAIMNPAEVLKQNAQMSAGGADGRRRWGHTVDVARQFARHPGRLWAGYTALTASHLPGTCLTFCLYERLKAALVGDDQGGGSIARRTGMSAVSAGIAGGVAAALFVPVDVVKTRMRLAAGTTVRKGEHRRPSPGPGSLAVARQVVRVEGPAGLFRGLGLTCVAAALGSGLYLGCYEWWKMYFGEAGRVEEELL